MDKTNNITNYLKRNLIKCEGPQNKKVKRETNNKTNKIKINKSM